MCELISDCLQRPPSKYVSQDTSPLRKKEWGWGVVGNVCKCAHCISDLESHNEYQHFKSAYALCPKKLSFIIMFLFIFKVLFIYF